MTLENEALTLALGDRYVLEREVGAGGSATVYLARDVRHRRPVAVKVLHPHPTTCCRGECGFLEARCGSLCRW